jgi:hypothetical protein
VEEDSPWYGARGEDGALAESSEPLAGVFTWEGEEHEIDSAAVLASLFMDLSEPAMVVGYAVLFQEILAAWRERIGLKADGSIELRVDGTDADEEELQRRTEEALEEAKAVAAARSLGEIEDLAPMVLQAARRALEEGWRVVVDG